MEVFLNILGLVAYPAVIIGFIWMICRVWMWLRRLSREAERADFPEERVCRECGYDLRASDDRCPECGARVPTEAERARERGDQLDPRALREDWPNDSIEPRVAGSDELPAVVHRTMNSFEADLLAQQLLARGIAATVQEKDEFELQGGVSRRRTNLLVVVPSGDEELARKIVDRFRIVPIEPRSKSGQSDAALIDGPLNQAAQS